MPILPAEENKKDAIQEIEIDRIIPNRYQPRQTFRPEALASLAESLKTQGLIQPIVVRSPENGKFELVAGERRWRAARLAGFSRIPAIVKNVQGQELMEWALLENIQREELHPIEKAHAYAKLISEFSLTQEEIAARIGIDRSSVANILRLLQLPEELWKEISEGTLTMGHAKAILSIEGKQEQLKLAEEIKKKGWSVRQAEAWTKKVKSGLAERASGGGPKSTEIADIEDRLRRSLGTKVRVTPRGKGGEIQIEYYTLDDLDRLLEKMI